MKKTLLTSFILASVSFGCSEAHDGQKNAKDNVKIKVVTDPALSEWVGHYSGITPCANCITRCEGCEGLGIDLKINADQTYVLERSDNNNTSKPEVFAGRFHFVDPDKTRIELIGVTDRNKLGIDEGMVEFIDTQTQQYFDSYTEFELDKST
ncbi:copper resistance protein NlpE N-terminal domain-containing protein [Acinetobacter stercoris]|uniref:Putative lipoprotein NlpE involved in copper resistance n=1 Tax=Acinetobacter stercoris TaxID=2126983 RepID=A0A2U3MWA6_9GAMM|nr:MULTISPECIES: copper resistance protein NlpE N-terminal domain-containing protein [Acinetobacter]SPL69718.1 putative lipoprotein NlpE involved in copper resistance [Acinetobacter stercoris]